MPSVGDGTYAFAAIEQAARTCLIRRVDLVVGSDPPRMAQPILIKSIPIVVQVSCPYGIIMSLPYPLQRRPSKSSPSPILRCESSKRQIANELVEEEISMCV